MADHKWVKTGNTKTEKVGQHQLVLYEYRCTICGETVWAYDDSY